jgi:hypothetical protein
MKKWHNQMSSKTKREIRSKARIASGLADVLKYDTGNIMSDANDCYMDVLIDTVSDTKETLQNLVDVVTEIEYLLYLEKFKES